MWGGMKRISTIQQIRVKYCKNGSRYLCYWESFKDSCLKKDDRKEGSSRLLVTLLAIMPFLNISLEGLSGEELNKFCAKSFVKEAKDKNYVTYELYISSIDF